MFIKFMTMMMTMIEVTVTQQLFVVEQINAMMMM